MFPRSGVAARRAAIPALLLLVALGGCSDLGRRLVLAPRGEVSAAAIDFGSVLVAQSATRTLTIRNTGNADLGGVASASCAHFQIVSGAGAFTLGPGASRELVLRFQPAAEGAFGCTLDLGPGLPQVTLAGSGALQAPGAAWSVSTAAIDFGALASGQAVVRAFTIRSVGSAPLLVNVVSSCADFLPLQGGGPRTLPPGDSVSVTVLFNPLSGGPFACVIATGPGGPEVRVSGFGTTVSLARDVGPILLSDSYGCVYCHVAGGGAPDMFQPGLVPLPKLVDVPSAYAWTPSTPAVRVRPFQPDSSVLYLKLVGDPRFGARMPQNSTPLSAAELARIRTWILEGARDN